MDLKIRAEFFELVDTGSLPRVLLSGKRLETGNIVAEPHCFPGTPAWPGHGSRIIGNLFSAFKSDVRRAST